MFMRYKSFGYSLYSKSQNNYLDGNTLKKLCKLHIKCKHCGHTIIPTKDRGICSYCGRWVYRNDKIEFRYKVLENLKMKEVR